MAVAAAVQAGGADCGMGVLSAAKALGLDFIPIAPEEYDFAMPAAYLELPMMQAFLEVLRSQEFKDRLEELGGYGYQRCGEIIHIQ